LGECNYIEGCETSSADNLFEGFKNKKEIIATIQDLQLSKHATMRRIEKMCGNITEQLLKDVSNCVAFSLHSNWTNQQTSETQPGYYFLFGWFLKIPASKKNYLE
jgi:hypothetical protein